MIKSLDDTAPIGTRVFGPIARELRQNGYDMSKLFLWPQKYYKENKMSRIKKNDTVVVLTGKDKDKKGTVIDVVPKEGKVLVRRGYCYTPRKSNKQGKVSQIKKQESYIQICKCNAGMYIL